MGDSPDRLFSLPVHALLHVPRQNGVSPFMPPDFFKRPRVHPSHPLSDR